MLNADEFRDDGSFLIELRRRMDIEVSRILRSYPETRDSDGALIVRYWIMYSGLDMTTISNNTQMIEWVAAHGKSAESITRIRRKLQKNNPSLQGKNWARRHAKDRKTRELLAQGQLDDGRELPPF